MRFEVQKFIPVLLLLLLFNTTRKIRTCCCCSTQRAQPPDPQARVRCNVLLLFNTTRTRSGPPSTRATIAMDGGVADTTGANTNVPVLLIPDFLTGTKTC
jgi:hypothetical protein